jgi:hypothetical protein
MFRVLFAHHWEQNNCVIELLDAKHVFYIIIVFPVYVSIRPQHVGVNVIIIVCIVNLIQFCAFVGLNYSNLIVLHGMENEKLTLYK